MKYNVKVISRLKKDKLLKEIKLDSLYQLKANIYGICIKLFTDDLKFKEMWMDNFEAMDDDIRPHERIISINEKSGKLKVLYEPNTKTTIIKNCDYYGWLKSIALGLANEYLEDVPSEHRRYSVHGSAIDYNGKGIGIIGTSGSGKTTLTYGLLLNEKFNYITDDWFFVRLKKKRVTIFSSEKNSYLREGLEKNWKSYKSKIKIASNKKDKYGRFIVDIRKFFGWDRINKSSNLGAIVLLTRNKKIEPFKKLNKKQAIEFMLENDFCNPHQLLKNKKKKSLRTKFFKELFSRVPIYLLNTIETPQESLNRLIELSEVRIYEN